jgi:hypothetical protein
MAVVMQLLAYKSRQLCCKISNVLVDSPSRCIAARSSLLKDCNLSAFWMRCPEFVVDLVIRYCRDLASQIWFIVFR